MKPTMKTFAALALSLALALTASACGEDDPSPTASGGGQTESSPKGQLPDGVNEADVSFAKGMIPHHREAVEMSQAVLDRGENAQVRDLATRIAGAQDPEIATMTGWLEQWGRPVVGTEHSMEEHSMDGDSMDGNSMEGMMTTAEAEELAAASGRDLDLRFVELMIKHHEGALVMAEEQVAKGTNTDAIQLATGIIAAQQAEIDEMTALLTELRS